MTAPEHGPSSPATTPGAPVDDRRADPPPPGSVSATAGDAPATEAERETTETVRSISRLEESN